MIYILKIIYLNYNYKIIFLYFQYTFNIYNNHKTIITIYINH